MFTQRSDGDGNIPILLEAGNMKKKFTKEEAKERHRITCKKYRQKNLEKIRESSKNYNKKNAKRRSEYNKIFLEKNPNYNKNYYESNKSRLLKRAKDWRERTVEYRKDYHKKYGKENLYKINAISSKRRASKIQRTPKWADLNKIKSFYLEAANLTKETNVKYVVDHVIPLQGNKVSGLHVENNLQVITEKENSKKLNKFEVI